ncbi:MAG: haloalkane dehalogenase [Herbinix sp.]|nr:haloalkane dehalogenase [Herbinix sp.]
MQKKIVVNGVTLSYKEIGTGDKYLISTQNFFLKDSHMELLGKPPYDYHVFLITMRGYGESDHVFDSTPQDYVKLWGEDVIAFAKAMEIDRFYYSGVSHGCFAGWYIAFHKPWLLKGFVPTSGVAQFIRSEARKMPTVSITDIDEIVGNYEALKKMAWIEHWPTQNSERLERREANHLNHLETLMNRRKEEFLITNNNISGSEAATVEEFEERLSGLEVPILIINGMLDQLSTPEKALRAAKLIPGAQLLIYQHFGHGGPDECPEIIARDCDRFFQDIEGRIL